MKIDNQLPSNWGEESKVAEERQVRPEQHVASLQPHPGHKVFEFDLATGRIQEAKIEQSVFQSMPVQNKKGYYHVPKATGHVSKKVIQRANCLYAAALNKKNALKKFIPMYENLVRAGKIIRHTTNSKDNDKS